MGLRGQPDSSRFSDESFRRCDIQFDSPKILVEAFSGGDESLHLLGTGRIGRPNSLPAIARAEVENALEAGDMPPAARHQQEQ